LDSANQLLFFVNNLIGQAQLETGRIVLKNRPFEPAELLEVARSAGSLQATKKGLRLDCEAAPDLPQPLHGDVYWLRQIVVNLVTNACKFTEAGSVRLRLYPHGAAEWAVEVADTGVGIAPEAQATIFDAFQQVDGSATRKYGGSGLGLSIVKELTGLMGGKIDLRSAPAQGTTIIIRLPYSEEKLS
jgi:signal transduction histidine kinase